MSIKFKKKKSLGQNFLKSKEILNKIIETSNLNQNDIVLEIGPGKGILTEKILEKAQKVIIIEKDDRLIEFLNKKFKKQIKLGQLKVIHKDILDFEVDFNEKYKIIANIPYYITGQIIRKFLSSTKQPYQMILMVQKEVAKRIVAKNEKESLLSISVKVYGESKYIKTVKAKYFSPKPKVDSAILLINNISKDFFKDLNEKSFFELIKASFSHKRKLLINNLKTNFKKLEKVSKKEIESIFEINNIDIKSRPENLSINDWKKILKSLNF